MKSFPKINKRKRTGWTTVRKSSSGGLPPLKQLSESNNNSPSTTTTTTTTTALITACAAAAQPSSNSSGCLEFGFEFLKASKSNTTTTNDDDNKAADNNPKELSQYPIFDLNNVQQVSTYLPGYTVQRQVTMSPNLTEIEQKLIQTVIQNCKRRYYKSNWVVIYHVEQQQQQPNNTTKQQQQQHPGVEWVAQQQLTQCAKDYPYSHYENWEPNVSKLLETGQLQGCELRGNAATAQLGLVASRDLLPGTPVAIEAGQLTSPSSSSSNADDNCCFTNAKKNKNSTTSISSNPLEALSSNYIPMTLLAPFLKSKKAKKVHCQYLASLRNNNNNNNQKGFVVDCRHSGSETKFIDDASWLQAGTTASTPKPPNLESSLVLDLQRHCMTVLFFTTVSVEKGDELTMDWGCWKEISQTLLPGQVLLSLIRDKEVRDLKKKKFETTTTTANNSSSSSSSSRKRKKVIDEQEEEEEEKAVMLHSSNLQGIDTLDANEYGPRFAILRDIYLQRDNSANTNTSRPQQNENTNKESNTNNNCWYKQLPVHTIDYTSPQVRHVVRPAKGTPYYSLLSNETRSKLNEIRVSSVSGSDNKPVRALLYEEKDLSTRVEVVEITNVRHPAVLLSLPNQTAYGVIAKRDFVKGEPVLCYGGVLIDDESDFEFDSYLFDIDLSSYIVNNDSNNKKNRGGSNTKNNNKKKKKGSNTKNNQKTRKESSSSPEDNDDDTTNDNDDIDENHHRVAVAGSSSVAGKINDPLSLFGYDWAHNNNNNDDSNTTTSQQEQQYNNNNNNKANLQAWNHFDGENKVPQIVLYATRDISAGDELLYEYGMEYWKIMWKLFMMEHASFVANADAKIARHREKQKQKRRTNPSRRNTNTNSNTNKAAAASRGGRGGSHSSSTIEL